METKWTPEQQKEHRKLWVEALRSGKYQQGRSVLKSPAGAMCCLGVACEISGLVKWAPLVGTGSNEGHEVDGEDRRFGRFYAPSPVIEWLGLADDAGSFGSSSRESLANMNDDGANFAAIANIIESEPPELIANV
jgi:hypothetical protein